MTGEAQAAYDACFNKGLAWKAIKSKKRVSGKSKRAKINRIMNRDGDRCFFCGLPLGDDITIEHLVPIKCGGGNHIANICLSHSECNKNAGSLSVSQKIKYREKLHKEKGVSL